MKLPTILHTISKVLQQHNAKAIVVGGAVRDHFLGLSCKDYDIEVYGLETIEQLEELLLRYGSVNLVGKSFGVLKFTYEGEVYDFSFPREEVKVATGHRGFDIFVDGNLSYAHAARRRDFTLNALGFDIEDTQFLDPFSGQKDIQNKTLRHIDENTFIDDPLRVYRALQFCARFGYRLAEETWILCQHMVAEGMLESLAKERIYEEFKKLLLKADKPSVGFELMRELGIVERYFPELEALVAVPQSPKWHPEGDVWIHTMMSVDAMATLCRSPYPYTDKQKLKFLFAILCHDLGKATHTMIEEDGRIRAIGHEYAGLAPTKTLMARLTSEHDFIEGLLPLVEHHLKPSQFYANKAKASAIRRLATKVTIEELVVVAKADFLGRTTEEALAGVYHAGVWLLEKAKTLKVENKPLDNLLLGRDLIALGFTPSDIFKEILDDVYHAYIDGALKHKEDALAYVKRKYLKS